MADALNDLSLVPQTSPDKNYFNLTIKNLKLSKTYATQFQWIYSDGQTGDWSPSYVVTTSNESAPAVPSSTVPSTSTGSIPVTLTIFPTNAKRVDVYVIGGIFGIGKVAYSFVSAGVATIAAPAGSYTVQLRSVSPTEVTSTVGTTFSITIADVGETIQAPTNPNGFSIDRVLSGIQVNWAGTYANGTFTGFEAIKIYVGNSATFTNGTYREAGVMTGNNVKNTITIPVDGTYLRYDLPVYIHAAGVNKSGTLGTVQVNVANNSLGARSAIASDLADQIITNAKLVDDAVTAAKIATAAITTTKISDDAITTPKLVANAITSDKIVSSAIIADKIAANAITAGKILAGEIDVTKLAAGTISTNNLEAGVITSTSYIRAGTKSNDGLTGARVEISSSTITQTGTNVLPGLYIYNSAGTAILSSPLTGGLSITGSLTATSISTSSGKFAVNSGGVLTATDVDLTGKITAASGSIGNWQINAGVLKSSIDAYPSILLDPGGAKIELRTTVSNISDTGNYIKMDTTSGLRVGTGGSPNFSVDMTGAMVSKSSTIYGKVIAASSGTYAGTLTIDGGYLSHNSGMYIETEDGFIVYTKKTSGGLLESSGYFLLSSDGKSHLGSGGTYTVGLSGFNSLNFTINNTDPGDGYRTRGYNLLNLDAAEFRQSSINNQYTASKTVVVDYYGQLKNGRALYYGPMGTSSTIHSDLGAAAAIGDLYFSTS